VFGQIKPDDLNKSIVWSLNFDRASTEVAGITIETGLLGLLAFELVAIMFAIYALYYLVRRSTHVGWRYALGFFVLWLGLYIAHFFYFFNTTFYFVYWIAIGLFMVSAHLGETSEQNQQVSMASSPRSAVSWMFASLLILAALLVGVFFEAAVYAADVAYASGLKKLNQPQPNFAEVSADLGRAVRLNPYRDVYLLAYGQNLIFRASEEAGKDEPNIRQIQAWIQELIAAGRKATEVSPAKAANWSVLAQFYNGIRPLVSGTDEFIIKSWDEAAKRDPKNPVLYIRLAQAYSNASEIIDPAIVGSGADADQDGLSDQKEQQLGANPQNSDTNGNGVSDGDEVKAGFNPVTTGRLTTSQLTQFTKVDQAKLALAEEALNKAIALKDDLPDSHIVLARVLEKSNRLSDARRTLDEAAKKFPRTPDILFEQGRITFNTRDFAEAERIFKEVIRLAPNHANAHFSLGRVYEQRNDLVGALAEYEKTREITGPNVELEKLINTLKDTQANPTE
jgi:tetratricopeptide (TPR) repeat protein